jgi:hypothetical protein
MDKGLWALGAVVSTLSLLSGGVQASTPVHCGWSGTFEAGAGPFNSRGFTIDFTVADPAVVGAAYEVHASLAIGGVGAWQQSTVFRFTPYVNTTAGLGAFTNVIQPGDSVYFGICSGGSCNDPVLWNGNAASPVLNTGTFALGLDASCTFPGGCNNAIVNWFDGQGGGTTTRYLGSLVVTSVPEAGTAALWSLGLGLGLGLTGIARVGKRRPALA